MGGGGEGGEIGRRSKWGREWEEEERRGVEWEAE